MGRPSPTVCLTHTHTYPAVAPRCQIISHSQAQTLFPPPPYDTQSSRLGLVFELIN